MRTAFSEALAQLATTDPEVLLLTGDHGYSLFDAFRRKCPDRFINAGIAEQNMVGIAAGLARAGYRPIVYGLSAFVPVRVIEQIKLDVAHDNLPVIFIGDGAGLVYSHLGTSHQSTEDIACTRAIPNLSVYSPADRFELIACMKIAHESKSPAYLRIGKADLGDVHASPPVSGTGALLQVKQGLQHGAAFIATGSMVSAALHVAATDYPDVPVWSAPFIKPIATDQIAAICASHSAVIVMEEHSVFGGLGSVVAEISSELAPTRILRIGINDRFSHGCGSYEYLLREHGLTPSAIADRIKNFVSGI